METFLFGIQSDMIELIFTIDYEIYGNGTGSLRELVYEPAERLKTTFAKSMARFVVFVEVAELEMIEAQRTDPALDLVKRQIREFHKEGFELGLHLHPSWYNASYQNGTWLLDHREYNLCTLPRERITEVIDRSIAYLRKTLRIPDFTPLAFRAGNWLFQPAEHAAHVLAERGIKVDSSVFKGGLYREHNVDYRRALRNGTYWRFTTDSGVPDPTGTLLELPIYTQMVPAWRVLTQKRVGLQRKGSSVVETRRGMRSRLLDFLRFQYPLKLDFCRLTMDELTQMMNTLIQEDQEDPESFRPVVAIGHTKDLVDVETVESFLCYLGRNGIAVTTFQDVYHRCKSHGTTARRKS